MASQDISTVSTSGEISDGISIVTSILPQLVASSKFLLYALSFLPNDDSIRKQAGTPD
jgi:hypothetical protein